MKPIVYAYPRDKEAIVARLRPRRALYDRSVLQGVYRIFDEVSAGGDAAVKAATATFDGVELDKIELTRAQIEAYAASVPAPLRAAMETAMAHIEETNRALLPKSWTKQIRPGTVLGEKVVPLDSVGIWIPCRKGPLVSTALMLVTAAKTAGVKEIAVGMPPSKDGSADAGTVAAARLAGAHRFVVGNGVAVIAGFTNGTESIPRVAGVFGPGPGGIAAAMSVAQSYGVKTALGLGPTECVVLADDTADPRLVALDLINEAEHGPDSAAILVTVSAALAAETADRLRDEIGRAAESKREILRHVFGPEGTGTIVTADSLEDACDWVSDFAPEHVMIVGTDRTKADALARIRNAGEILLGAYTPFSAANYAIGIPAVLPTNGFARSFSGVTSRDMVKISTVGELSRRALEELVPIVEKLGEYERLPGHVQAAEARFR